MKIEATVTKAEKITLSLPDYFRLDSEFGTKAIYKVVEGSAIVLKQGLIVWDTELAAYHIETIERGTVTEITADQFYSELNNLKDQLK